MNRQDIFNKVANHLLKQKERSLREGSDSCAYRGSNGLRCAIGCLIDDSNYSPNLEGLGAGHDSVCEAIARSQQTTLEPDDWVFLHDLQRIHDAEHVGNWGEELKRFAKNHELEFNPQD